MFGKTLKVVEYNLTFGANDRLVNVFGCFRYLKNNNLYLIYADVNTKYEIIHYGSSHIKGDTILSMSPKQEDMEIIKEFIYKVINNEDLSNFQIINLTDINGIEIISSNNLEVKLEVIKKLEELTIPVKKEVSPITEEIKKETSPKVNTEQKKKKKTLLLVLLGIIIILGGGYFYLSTILSNTVSKKIICTKEGIHNELKATLSETNIYHFYNNNELSSVDITNSYKFTNEEDYQNFTYRGLYYKYMPTDNATPKWDNNTYTFEVKYKETVDVGYKKPQKYEEVINYYSSKGYSCKEEIEKN